MATISGTITLSNGETASFELDGSQYSGYQWNQWNASNDTLWETAEALDAIAEALNRIGFDPEPECEECGCEISRGETVCEDCQE